MMTSTSYWRIALPCPLRQLFTYSCSNSESINSGCWVEVSFGRRRVVGLVMEKTEKPQVSYEIKSIYKQVWPEYILPKDLLELILWGVRYYHAPPWEMISTSLPSQILKGKKPSRQMAWYAIEEAAGVISSRAKKQQQLFDWLCQVGTSSWLEISGQGYSRAILRQLRDAGAINSIEIEPKVQTLKLESVLQKPSADQQRALNTFETVDTQPVLLDGVTGSGKTLIYQHLARKYLEQGKQILILVPEIGLIPQMKARFSQLVAEPITYHSGLGDSQRAETWQACLTSRARLVIGTRSSLFLPFADLGLIVVDEEHDLSYKQQETPRYQARDMAVVRATRLAIPILLGSATPSLETLYNVRQNNFRQLQLPERVGGGQSARWQILEGVADEKNAGLLEKSLSYINQELKSGNQVLVFINRRGYSPCLRCSQCGWQARCDQCDSRYTLHKGANELRCHRCDLSTNIPKACPECSSKQLSLLGQGTERVAHRLAELFPDTPLIRIDRDATRGKEGIARKLDQVHASGPAILVGTQMLAKGHHFPKLGMALILDADHALMSSDFRAIEHMVQLLTQIAGRVGREMIGGKVLLQTEFAGHPVVTDLVADNYAHFSDKLLRQRQQWQLPPYSYLAILRIAAEDSSVPPTLLNELVKLAESSDLKGFDIIGPLPSPTEKKSGRYRFQIQISAQARSNLHAVLSLLVASLDQDRLPKGIRWHLDVDPASLD